MNIAVDKGADRNALDDFGGLLDWPRINQWLDAQPDVPGRGPVSRVRKLAGGVQNNVFLIERGATTFVLRRPSRHLRPGSNETMLREARILKALEGTTVPHPRVYASCDDATVTGASFYVMEPLDGFAPSGELPVGYANDADWRRAMGDELVGAAVALAAVDPQAVGLADLGKPQDWHQRQVARWQQQLEGYRATPGYDAAALPHVDVVGQWLGANLPSDRRIGLIHGDLQFANVLFSRDMPKIAGVVDWELATLGDPLLDLGWILTSWWEDGDPDGKRPLVRPWQGFRTRAELVQRYGELSGRDMREMPWFFALACYKLAGLLEGTYARSLAGQVPANVGASVHAYAQWLMNKARQIIAG